MVNSFATNFWDNDFNGTVGYDTLVTRLKDGKKLYDGFSDFLRNRAKLEDDYGKNLMKLAQTEAGKEETGSLKASWESVKKETENIGYIHCELGKQLNILSETSLQFRETQKQERIRIDESMRKEQKEKKASHDAMMKAKRLYEQRCKEYDLAKKENDAKSYPTPKEDEKLRRNMLKSKTSAESADSLYQGCVKQLEDLRKKYISNMEDACEKFQAIEEGRIRFLRNEMWLYTNHGSTHAVNIEQRYEECRTLLEKCDEKYDVQSFIQMRQTGSIPPSPIEYVNYYHKEKASVDFSTNIETKNSQNLHTPFTGKSSSNPNLLSNNSQHARLPANPNQLSFSGQHVHTSSSPNIMSHHDNTQHAEQYDSPYASVSEIYTSATTNKSPKKACAAFLYQSQSSQELTLNPGDIIEIKNIVDETWAIGALDGKIGAFPLTYVDLIE